ncbi:carbohydrate ABC transporter permease [Ornithinimicrobium sp. INDO-MA30-4]|uniref:carbohydrate ABC transporter permease n=1 Tax=Ornithinimicrobium sp. INDO-MA30-4 TaxID=2908651 RepID=UPI001F1CFB87|nr:sugar ABC transporter permease [Ornithinimicrobium sp. INDO-MA30-4]UJH71278.1 sugar ABC transporter permease [Ornithinimicrobium sp. INDO-MA30-4]
MDFLLDTTTAGEKIIVMLIAVALFVAVMGFVLWLADKPSVPRLVTVAGFVGPALLLLVLGLLYPALLTIIQSFQSTTKEFVFLDNYATIFGTPSFRTVLFNTALWVVLVPLLSTGFGLMYAVLVDRAFGEKLAKTLVFMPMAISMVGASIIWKFVYEFRPDQAGIEQIGLLNQLLVMVGFEPQQFLLSPPLNNLFLIAVMVWIQAGFAMTVLSAAIKSIPDEIIEAAKMDGVQGMAMFRYVTLPSVRPAVVVVITTVAMATLKVFDIVRTMTGGQFETSIVANEFYSQSFSFGRPDIGAALAVLLFVLVIPIILYNIRQMRLSEEQR